MRLTSCCCGCSLRTGTLIILWLDLLINVSNIAYSIVVVCQPDVQFTFLYSVILTWQFISLVAMIYALAGVEKHRPSYMLPSIGIHTAYIIGIALCIALMWIGPDSVRMQAIDIINYLIWFDEEDILEPTILSPILLATILSAISFVIHCYFLNVIYCYYKQMRDGNEFVFNRNAGAVHATQASQPKNNFNACPPVFDQQPTFNARPNTGPLSNASELNNKL